MLWMWMLRRDAPIFFRDFQFEIQHIAHTQIHGLNPPARPARRASRDSYLETSRIIQLTGLKIQSRSSSSPGSSLAPRMTSDVFTLATFAAAELPRRLSRVPALARRFEAELRMLLDTVWDAEDLEHQLLAMSTLVERAQQDVAYDQAIAGLTGWIRHRRAFLDAQLQIGLPAGPAQGGKCTEFPGGFDFGRDGLELMTLVLLGL